MGAQTHRQELTACTRVRSECLVRGRVHIVAVELASARLRRPSGMSWLFAGKQKTPAELLKEYKRNIDRSVREIEREKNKLQQQEKKFYGMKTQMQAVGLKLQTIKSTQAMTDAMKGAAKAMKGMNARVNPAAMQKILMEFEKQSEIMDSKQEMMDDCIDDAFDEDDEEQQAEDVVQQVMSELGIDLSESMALPQAGAVNQAKATEADVDLELEARLANLKGAKKGSRVLLGRSCPYDQC